MEQDAVLDQVLDLIAWLGDIVEMLEAVTVGPDQLTALSEMLRAWQADLVEDEE